MGNGDVPKKATRKEILAAINDDTKQKEYQFLLYKQYRALVLIVLDSYRDGLTFIPLGEYLDSLLRLEVSDDFLAPETVSLKWDMERELKAMCETLGYFCDGVAAYGKEVYVKSFS